MSFSADWRRASVTSKASAASRSSNALRVSANCASSADSRCLERLADLGELGQRVARGAARLVALAADLLERGAQLLALVAQLLDVAGRPGPRRR